VVPDDDPNSITVMFKNTHNHSDCNQTSPLPSPLRQSVSQYVRAGSTESQIRSSLSIDHAAMPVPSSKLKYILTKIRILFTFVNISMNIVYVVHYILVC
ncbi:unnamed protein product, partial [Rotaria sp. Silwood1]